MSFDAVLRDWRIALAVLVSVLVLSHVVVAWAKRAWQRRTMRVRMTRAARGEKQAISILEESGFEITGAQVAVEYSVHVDGEPTSIALRADYLVAKNGARFVAEVKTGALAPRIETAATRRQLLEYGIAFDVDGVLLVDAESGAIHEVRFPAREKREASSPARAWIWTAFAIVIAALILMTQR